VHCVLWVQSADRAITAGRALCIVYCGCRGAECRAITAGPALHCMDAWIVYCGCRVQSNNGWSCAAATAVQPAHAQLQPSSCTAYSLQPTAYSLQPTAYSLQPTAYSLQPTAYSLQPTASQNVDVLLTGKKREKTELFYSS
jgi:hypothetical protein